ncbi:MAG: hypothetical protein K6F94_09700 [Bacteroidaceae bacterium]|nr:hypothetical protein [Bacteroidaceae bacterium]
MNAEEEKILRNLQTQTRQLILRFQQLKQENDDLVAQFVKKDDELKEMQLNYRRLSAEYANLKMAKMLEIGEGDIASAKQRMAKLVRDVDKCIALLKGLNQ